MIGPWRATTLAALIAVSLASSAFAQSAKPNPNGAAKEPFGADVTLTARTIIYLKGNGSWDNALDILQDAFKSVYAYLDKQAIPRAGLPMTIYSDFDDTNFTFQAAVPIAECHAADSADGTVGDARTRSRRSRVIRQISNRESVLTASVMMKSTSPISTSA